MFGFGWIQRVDLGHSLAIAAPRSAPEPHRLINILGQITFILFSILSGNGNLEVQCIPFFSFWYLRHPSLCHCEVKLQLFKGCDYAYILHKNYISTWSGLIAMMVSTYGPTVTFYMWAQFAHYVFGLSISWCDVDLWAFVQVVLIALNPNGLTTWVAVGKISWWCLVQYTKFHAYCTFPVEFRPLASLSTSMPIYVDLWI